MAVVQTRAIGKRRPLLEDWSIHFPPEWTGGDGGDFRLRDLIERVVRAEVEMFARRQKARGMVSVLTEAKIEDGAEKGRIDSGGRVLKQNVDSDEAVGAALQAFEDGMYLVIIDETEFRDLDAPVRLSDDSNIIFIRLTFLAGG